MGNRDTRTQAELLLAPRVPLERVLQNVGAMKLGIGGKSIPGVISDAKQLVGPIRNTFTKALRQKKAVEGLSAAVTKVLAGFDNQKAQLQSGAFVPPHPMLTVPAIGVPSVAAFFSFSSLNPGQKIPAAFGALIEQRKKQLQQLVKGFSSVFSSTAVAGVSVVENTNPQPYPLPNQMDIPDVPRLAQGGKAAQAEPILADKTRFAVRGVTIGAGKPNTWGRNIAAAASAVVPNLNATVNQVFRDRNKSGTWSEPPTPYAAQFPYNHVQQTESGHVFELDDTPGAERVHVFHRSGSFLEFHPDGSMVYRCMKHNYRVTMADDHVKVSGNCHVAVDGNSTLYVKGNVDMQADGDMHVQVKGDYNVFAKNINLRAKKKFKADGTIIDLRYITLPYSIGLITPMGGGPFFVPRINLTAMVSDFPGSNFIDIGNAPPSMDPLAGHPVPVFGDTIVEPAVENPLSNWSVYAAVTPLAIAYRAKFFDTPEEVNDVELYSGHTSLQNNLGDVTETSRRLSGQLRATDSGLVEPDSKPTVNYLTFDDFKGTFDYANNYPLGGTSFLLSDVSDMSLYPDIVQDTLPMTDDNFEGTPEDTTGLMAGGLGDSDTGGDELGSDTGDGRQDDNQSDTTRDRV